MRTRQLTVALMTIAAVSLAAADAVSASSLAVRVTPDVPGTATAPLPTTVTVSADLTGADGRRPPSLRGLTVAAPDGFVPSLAGTTSCSRAVLESAGPTGCATSSKLGAGDAGFVYVSGQLELPVSTDELSVFRGPGDEILVYARVTLPAALSVVGRPPPRFTTVVPGRLVARPAPLGPLVTLDFSVAPTVPGGFVVVSRASFALARGLAAGPCPAGRWTFGARLAYAGGVIENLAADARCRPDVTSPVLGAKARSGSRALGARFALTLSEAANVRLTLERRVGRRWVSVRKVTRGAPAAESVLRVRRANGRLLAIGRYRARLRAVDAAGLQSGKVSVTFRLR